MLRTLTALAALSTPLCAQLDVSRFSAMTARNIGPAGMSGRVAAVEVVLGDPATIYVGAAAGGVWKSVDGGITWNPIFDDQPTASIGAIAVFDGNPDHVWVGTGEGNPRNSAGVGRGMFKSIDGGHSWKHLGLERSERIHRVVLHPTNPDIAYAAVLGPTWSDGSERGVYRTRDGGTSWERVLFENERTGASDLVMDPRNPHKLYAGMWEHRRWPWFFESGGVGSGLYVSYDGGDNWSRYSADDGLPSGALGRIGLAVAQNEPGVVYALVEASRSALLRSDDGGLSWRTIRSGPGTAPRPFYYADIRVDPTNENRVYNLHSSIQVSEDQGRTFRTVVPSSKIHGDVQELWIGPTGKFLIMGNDGGVAISHDRGATWRFVENLPLAQFYHINVDMETPFNVYGGLQDNGSWYGPSQAWIDGGIRNYYWTRVGGGDGFATIADFGNERYGYTESQQGNVRRFDRITGERKDVRPVHPDGTDLRFNWNAAMNVDPFDSSVIYLGSQFVHRSGDGGHSWEVISPDLTTNDPEKQRSRESGGITLDASGAENHTAILTIAPSPVERGVIWVGTDDGNVQVLRNGEWSNVAHRVPNVPANTWVPHIEPSKFDGAAAFLVMDDHRRGNWNTYVFETNDYGRSWRSLATDEIDGFAHVIEQDPVEPNLLFVGTEFGLYVSVDGGAHWARWTHGTPTAPYRALLIHPRDHDLVMGTHGRAAFVLDDIRPLRELARDPSIVEDVLHLFEVPDTYQHTVAESMMRGYRSTGDAMYAGDNRAYGAMISFWTSRADPGRTTIEILAGREIIRSVSHSSQSGLNRLHWDLRHRQFSTPGANASGTLNGPEALPGTYSVRIRMNGEESIANLAVHPDPRYAHSGAEHRVKFDALMQTGQRLEVAAELVNRTRSARRDLERAANSFGDDQGLANRGSELEERFQRIADRIVAAEQDGGFGGAGANLVGGQLRSVYGSMESSWDRPTAAQSLRLRQAVDALRGAIEEFNGVVTGAFAVFRRDAAAAGVRMSEVGVLTLDWVEEGRSDR